MILSALALVGPRPVVGQDAGAHFEARQTLSVEPQEAVPEALSRAEREDWEGLQRALSVLEPLLAIVPTPAGGAYLSVMREASGRRDAVLVRDALLSFARDAVSELVAESISRPPEERRQIVRQAFAEFVAISPHFGSEDFQIRRQAERSFRQLYASVGAAPEPFADRATEVTDLLGQLAGGR